MRAQYISQSSFDLSIGIRPQYLISMIHKQRRSADEAIASAGQTDTYGDAGVLILAPMLRDKADEAE